MNNTTVTVTDKVVHIVTVGVPGPPGAGGSGGSYVGGLEPVTNGDSDFPELMFSDGDVLMVSVT